MRSSFSEPGLRISLDDMLEHRDRIDILVSHAASQRLAKLRPAGLACDASNFLGAYLMSDGRPGSPLRHLSTIGNFEPGDERHGDWSRERLEKMDRRFLAQAEHAIPRR